MANVGSFIKLVHVTTVPMTLGFLQGQVCYMQDRGFEVEAISSPGDALDAFAESQQVQTHPVTMCRSITLVRDLGAVGRIVRLLLTIQPAVLHSHTPKAGLLGMVSAYIARTPVRIYHMRGLPYMTALGRRRALLKATERISCALAHRVICVSPSIRDVAIVDGVCAPDKIVVFGKGSGNGVDATGRFDPARFIEADRATARGRWEIGLSDLVIGFVGRVVRDKGIEELVAAWKGFRDTHPSAHLVIAGPVESQNPVSPSTLETLRADPRVHMLGMVSDPSIVYPVFDIVVLPTYREGFPNVPLEAAAMNLPVVATLIPGCIDAVENGVTGTLVPPRDADALRGAIERYLDDPALRQAHGLAGRARVLRDFRQEVIWGATYQEYVRLLKEKGIAVPLIHDTNNQV